VFHLHFHILPRWEGVALKPPGGPIEKPEILAAHAEKIVAALGVGQDSHTPPSPLAGEGVVAKR